MNIGLCFWILMLIWAVFGGLLHFGMIASAYAGVSTLLLFVLFVLIGWQLWGAPLHK
jgi:uncharacterized membrane protein YtjA (UPF0391 family)